MKDNDPPDIDVVKSVAKNHFHGISQVERVPKGVSTYVYRITTGTGTFYLRFLPENASFATEALAHTLLTEKGVIVPRIIDFEHKNKETGMSTMITEEISGVSVEDDRPETNLREILNEAGRQIALVHQVPVDGFGWIDRTSYDTLKGVHKTFSDFFNEDLNAGLQSLERFDFTEEERNRIPELIRTAGTNLNVDKAVLVHGDFDVSHIFHHKGRYTGLIDFGEIRGNTRLYDLMSFACFDRSPDRVDYTNILEGYQELSPVSDADLYAVDLFVLSRSVFAMGSITDRPRLADFFYRIAKKQFELINTIYG